ncbi:unnamed protein product [Cunninghamella blakesleeana]
MNNSNITQSTYSEDFGVKSLVDEEDHNERVIQSSHISKNKSILHDSDPDNDVDKGKVTKYKNYNDTHGINFHSKIPKTLKPLITNDATFNASSSSSSSSLTTILIPTTKKSSINKTTTTTTTTLITDSNDDTNFPNSISISSPTSNSSYSPDDDNNNNKKKNSGSGSSGSSGSNNNVNNDHENVNTKLTPESYPSSPTSPISSSSSSSSSSPLSSPMTKKNNSSFQLRQPTSMLKNMGHMRIIICGDSGIGKSSLIQAFKILPEIIMINDDLTTARKNNKNQWNKNETHLQKDVDINKSSSTELLPQQEEVEGGNKNQIKEYYYSTTTIPSWQDEYQSFMEDLKINRKDDDDTDDTDDHVQQLNIAANNICLIDTPGYGASVDAKSVIQYITNYLERQFQITNQLFSPILPNSSQMKKLLINSEGGHTHVDACLYLILDRLKPVDIEFLRSIQHFCNIIPVIVKSDLLSREQEQKLRYTVLKELLQNDIDIFKCNYSYDQLLKMCLEGDTSTIPFSISTKSTISSTSSSSSLSFPQQQQQKRTHHDQRFYTASAYSKLAHLKDMLFYIQSDHLRYSTASKFLHWRRQQTNIVSATSSLSSISPLYSSILSSSSSSSLSATTSSSSLFSSIPQPMTPTCLTNSSFSIANHYHSQQEQEDDTKIKQETLMIDLENLSYQLTTREIAERIQELRKRQTKNIHLKIKEYMKMEQEKMDKKAQEDIALLKKKYNQWEQQQKIEFLTKEMETLISLHPPQSGTIHPQDKKKYSDGIKYLKQVHYHSYENTKDHPKKKQSVIPLHYYFILLIAIGFLYLVALKYGILTL